jgi:hypothetical protein
VARVTRVLALLVAGVAENPGKETKNMTTRSANRLGLAAMLLAMAAGCGSPGSGSGSGTGILNVHLVDGPGDFSQINLHVVQVSIHSDSDGWVILGTNDQTVDLLTLTGGVSATLAAGATVPAGHYTQMRLLLGSGNTVVLADGSVHDLKVPSGLQSGVKLIVNFDVAAGTTRDVFIDFDAHRSIFLHAAGASGQYILRPVIRAFDALATGSISGVLTGSVGEGSEEPLVGALVTAQVLSAGGVASIVRSATSGAGGQYTLDLLPVGFSYYVVGQPVVGATAYMAKSSGPILIDEATPIATYDALFDVAAETGGVGGTISPTATLADADTVDARQVLDAGGTPQSLIVRTAVGAVSGLTESYLIENLPAGAYSLSDTRRTLDAAGNETVKTSPEVPATVTGGAVATANLVLP